jgi:hypothetical protein
MRDSGSSISKGERLKSKGRSNKRFHETLVTQTNLSDNAS